MRLAYPSVRVSTRATLTFFLALLVGAIALLSLGTRPAETKPTSAQPFYTVQDLGTLGSFSIANGINDAGKVVGYSTLPETSEGSEAHAYLYSNRKMSDLGTLGGSESYAYSINNSDQVVGESTKSDDGAYYPFLYSNRKTGMKDLNSLILADSGWQLDTATDINDNGYIVGKGHNPDGEEHAFLLIPTQRGGHGPG